VVEEERGGGEGRARVFSRRSLFLFFFFFFFFHHLSLPQPLLLSSLPQLFSAEFKTPSSTCRPLSVFCFVSFFLKF